MASVELCSSAGGDFVNRRIVWVNRSARFEAKRAFALQLRLRTLVPIDAAQCPLMLPAATQLLLQTLKNPSAFEHPPSTAQNEQQAKRQCHICGGARKWWVARQCCRAVCLPAASLLSGNWRCIEPPRRGRSPRIDRIGSQHPVQTESHQNPCPRGRGGRFGCLKFCGKCKRSWFG